MDILQHLKDYKMKRFFSNNCSWTKECKKEYKALNTLIDSITPTPIPAICNPKPMTGGITKEEVIHNEIHNSNIGQRFMEEAINDMYDEPDDPFTGF